MASWSEFAKQAPEIAEFGALRFSYHDVAYFGTVRADGSPRVHPVTPILDEQLFLFMEPTSPKGKELRRDPRYTLHCAVEDSNGGQGEFYVRGHATWCTNLQSAPKRWLWPATNPPNATSCSCSVWNLPS